MDLATALRTITRYDRAELIGVSGATLVLTVEFRIEPHAGETFESLAARIDAILQDGDTIKIRAHGRSIQHAIITRRLN
jgi:hypothetical protein